MSYWLIFLHDLETPLILRRRSLMMQQISPLSPLCSLRCTDSRETCLMAAVHTADCSIELSWENLLNLHLFTHLSSFIIIIFMPQPSVALGNRKHVGIGLCFEMITSTVSFPLCRNFSLISSLLVHCLISDASYYLFQMYNEQFELIVCDLCVLPQGFHLSFCDFGPSGFIWRECWVRWLFPMDSRLLKAQKSVDTLLILLSEHVNRVRWSFNQVVQLETSPAIVGVNLLL